MNVEVVCGPRVLVVVHRRRKDHGKDLKLSQPVLEAKKERKKRKKGGGHGEVKIREEVRILRDIYRSVNIIERK